jgi:hypothetical protein
MYICYVLDVRLVDDDYHLTPISISCLSYFLLIFFETFFLSLYFRGLSRTLWTFIVGCSFVILSQLVLYLVSYYYTYHFILTFFFFFTEHTERERKWSALTVFSFLFNWISLVMVVSSPYSIYLLRTIFFQKINKSNLLIFFKTCQLFDGVVCGSYILSLSMIWYRLCVVVIQTTWRFIFQPFDYLLLLLPYNPPREPNAKEIK